MILVKNGKVFSSGRLSGKISISRMASSQKKERRMKYMMQKANSLFQVFGIYTPTELCASM